MGMRIGDGAAGITAASGAGPVQYNKEKTMKRILFALAFLLLTASLSTAQVGERDTKDSTREMTVKFPQPSRPGIVKILSGQGNIVIKGTSGSEVNIFARSDDADTFEENEKAKGMKRISGTRFNVSSDHDNNAIVITRPMTEEIQLEIEVPHDKKLILGGPVDEVTNIPNAPLQQIVVQSINMAFYGRQGGSVFNGDVEVSDFSGEMEISTLDGDVVLSNVTGSAMVNTFDGDITAVFKSVTKDKPMSFSTIEGDVDITLPKKVNATVASSNVDGEVYTDFDMDLSYDSSVSDEQVQGAIAITQKNKNKTGGNQRAASIFATPGMAGNSITGKINGGGPVIMLKTVDGDIYIRSGK